MRGYSVPDPVSSFVGKYIHSVEHLEILLLLQGTPDKAWSAAEVSRTLAFHPDSTAARLTELHSHGLLMVQEEEKATSPPLYCFRPRLKTLVAVVTRLAEVYKQRPVAIITLIYSKPQDHIQSFADAFKLRKDKDEDS